MKEQELKEFLFHSMRLRGDHLPNYHVNLSFESENLDEAGLEEFVVRLQFFLNDNGLGELLMFGVDEDYRSGDFKILCSDTTQIQFTSDQIKTLLEGLDIFNAAYITMLLPTESGGYVQEGFLIDKFDVFREDSDEINAYLPVPEGFEEDSRWGCLPQIIAMMVLVALFSLIR